MSGYGFVYCATERKPRSDYRGAKAAGLRPLLLQRPEKDQLVPEEAKEDIITSLTEVVDLVDKWNGRTDSQPSN